MLQLHRCLPILEDRLAVGLLIFVARTTGLKLDLIWSAYLQRLEDWNDRDQETPRSVVLWFGKADSMAEVEVLSKPE